MQQKNKAANKAMKVVHKAPKPAPETITDLYLFVMILVFPLYTGWDGYLDITDSKYEFFLIATMIYLATMVLGGVGTLMLGEAKPAAMWQRLRHFSIVQWGMLGYLMSCTLSAIWSEYGWSTWIGLGRQEGLRSTMLYVSVFLMISFFGKFGIRYVFLYGATVLVNLVISLLQFAGKNPLGLYPEGLTYQDAFIKYSNQYLGTIGNVGLMAGFLCLAAPLFYSGYVRLEGKRYWLLLFPWIASIAILTLTDVLAGLVGMFGMLVITAPFLMNSRKRLMRGIQAIGFGLLTFGATMSIIQTGSDWKLILVLTGVALVLLSFFARLGQKPEPESSHLSNRVGWASALTVTTGLAAVYFIKPASGFFYEMHQILHGTVSDLYGSYRIGIWREVLRLIPEHWLLGAGPDTLAERFGFPMIMQDPSGNVVESYIDVAHNDYLNIIVNTGLVSFFTYLVSIIGTIINTVKYYRSNTWILLCGTSLACYLIQIFFNYSLVIVSPLFWIMLGWVDNASYQEKAKV